MKGAGSAENGRTKWQPFTGPVSKFQRLEGKEEAKFVTAFCVTTRLREGDCARPQLWLICCKEQNRRSCTAVALAVYEWLRIVRSYLGHVNLNRQHDRLMYVIIHVHHMADSSLYTIFHCPVWRHPVPCEIRVCLLLNSSCDLENSVTQLMIMSSI